MTRTIAKDASVAIVTGVTHLEGIGFAIAKKLSQHTPIAICGRNLEKLKLCAEHLEKESKYTIFFQCCDIRSIEQCQDFVETLVEKFPQGISLLVNNAGGQFPCPAALLSSKGFAAVINNNLCGTFNMISAVSKRCMLLRQEGRIINIVADVKRGYPGLVHTGAARAAVVNLTKSLAVEWAPYNIRINAVAPGTISSSGLSNYPEELVKHTEGTILLRRFGEPREVASLVDYLSQPESDYITGQCFYIDGGASLYGDKFDTFAVKVRDAEIIRKAKL